ncbi:rod-binding protein [Jannaschia sp. CCS1]|uniref:rod-binding protein n=1 Tax=Jannaschia sp. (strain CCS1) TaxID=290400 RepID=UPI000053CBB6|nr:flagellar protein FlgJ putative [Jannaschia sp. CCS1]
MTTPILSSTPGSAGSMPTDDPHARIREVAQDLEAAFLAEMLKHAGFGEPRDDDSFGGGIGEEQFSSMLRDQHASAISERGGLGLAESIFQSLLRRSEGVQ